MSSTKRYVSAVQPSMLDGSATAELRGLLEAFSEPCLAEAAVARESLRLGVPESRLCALVEALVAKGLLVEPVEPPRFEAPVFVLSLPRAGSTLLFDTLRESPSVWSVADEAHHIFERVPWLRAESRGFSSMRATEKEASPEAAAELLMGFTRELVDRDDRPFLGLEPAARPRSVRFIEKTPRNCLRVRFLKAAFPDAKFVFLHRDARRNVASMMEGWLSGRYVTLRELPGWSRGSWSFLLPEGWQELDGRPLAEVVAFQWREGNRAILDDLESLDPGCWRAISYSRLVADPGAEIRRLCEFAGFEIDARLAARIASKLPHSRSTVTAPDADKWRKHGDEIERAVASCADMARRLDALEG